MLLDFFFFEAGNRLGTDSFSVGLNIKLETEDAPQQQPTSTPQQCIQSSPAEMLFSNEEVGNGETIKNTLAMERWQSGCGCERCLVYKQT